MIYMTRGERVQYTDWCLDADGKPFVGVITNVHPGARPYEVQWDNGMSLAQRYDRDDLEREGGTSHAK